jgi:hypothetical protein
MGLTALHVELDKPTWRPGELVVGRVRLESADPIEASRLVVGLSGRQRAVGLQPGQQSLQLSYRNDKVWDFYLTIDGERAYRPGEQRRFELLVPRSARAKNFEPPGGLLEEVTEALSLLSNVKRFPVDWRIYAFLERPNETNLRGEVVLQLEEPDETTSPSGRALAKPVEIQKPVPTLKKKRTTSRKKQPKKKTTTRAKKKPAR